MAIDYSSLVSLATRLLGEFGKQTAYIRTKGSSYNTTTGTVTDTESDAAVNAVQVEYNEFHAPGAQIQQGDIFWMLDGLPGIKDELYISGDIYDVVQIWPIKPGDTFIACRVQTRIGVAGAPIDVPANALTDADGNPLQFVDGDYIETVD